MLRLGLGLRFSTFLFSTLWLCSCAFRPPFLLVKNTSGRCNQNVRRPGVNGMVHAFYRYFSWPAERQDAAAVMSSYLVDQRDLVPERERVPDNHQVEAIAAMLAGFGRSEER